jgi:hypothetical protein
MINSGRDAWRDWLLVSPVDHESAAEKLYRLGNRTQIGSASMRVEFEIAASA